MVLLIHRNQENAESVSEIFHYMGVVSVSATPMEALSIISPNLHAVIIIEPELLPDIRDYVKRLKRYAYSTPVYALTNLTGEFDNHGFDHVFPNSGYSSTLLIQMAKLNRAAGIPVAGIYMLAGINASCDRRMVTFLDKPIPFTRTEAMILRYLIASYPEPKSADLILENAFKKSKHPEPSAIRTHVSLMNKKFRKYTNRTLILSVPGKGYAVYTPELVEKLAKQAVANQN